jgi:hypothetical protein
VIHLVLFTTGHQVPGCSGQVLLDCLDEEEDDKISTIIIMLDDCQVNKEQKNVLLVYLTTLLLGVLLLSHVEQRYN